MLSKRGTTWTILSVVGNLGLAIAVPLVIFGLIGRFIDKHYHTSPWFLLAGIFLALIMTTITLASKMIKLLKDLEKANKGEDQKDNNSQ